MMTLKIERVKSKVKTVSMQRNTAVFLAVLQNILTLREGFKKKKKKNWNFPVWGGVSDGGSIFQFLKPSLIFARFSTIFGGFLSSIFQFSGGGGGLTKTGKFQFFFLMNPSLSSLRFFYLFTYFSI